LFLRSSPPLFTVLNAKVKLFNGSKDTKQEEAGVNFHKRPYLSHKE
jgi:hypothetical protein